MSTRARKAAKRFRLKRVYEPPAADDGLRVLVDRLWPRGLSKSDAKVDLWLRDVAPSHELRREFHDRPDAWSAFVDAYAKELEGPLARAALAELTRCDADAITLLFAARDERHNNAAALLDYLRNLSK